MGAVLTGLRYFRAWLLPAMFLVMHGHAAARDPDRPRLPPNHSSPKIQSCEGFFTLGRDSELVIGAEERLDCLIREGACGAEIEAFDQDAYRAARERAIAEFAKDRQFDHGRDLPPGMKITLRNLDEVPAGNQTLYTAALDEQSTRLREALTAVTEFQDHVRLESGNERFVVRQSVSFLPTSADRAAVREAQRGWPGDARGILLLNQGRANTLVIYK